MTLNVIIKLLNKQDLECAAYTHAFHAIESNSERPPI